MQDYSSDPLVGTLVDGRYLIQSRLASGGMSTVYVATDRRLERDVALKVLHPHMTGDPQFLDRLGREAKAAARLSHPHVVGVLDQGEDDRVAYLVMEYIKGHTLRDVLKDKGALPPRLALALIDPVVEGLGAAHDAGLIHRDIKPENVLIADDGRIKLGDFGLARAISTSTSTGALIGTVAYLSPELVLGRQADARSDIYSVGIMLYEMITGRQPFDGEVPIQVAYQHVNSSVGAPSELVPGLAAEIDELVQWCTANDPDKRPVDGNALLSELRHIRRNLSDAELDLQPPAARPALPAVPPPPSPPAGRPGGAPDPRAANGATEVIGGRQQPTEFIARGNNPTTVMSAAPRHPGYGPLSAPDEAPYAAGDYDDDDGAAPPFRPANGRSANSTATRRRRASAPRPRRSGACARATPGAAACSGSSSWSSRHCWPAGPAGSSAWGRAPPARSRELANKTVAEAQQLLRTAGFQSTTKDVFDDDVAARARGRLGTCGRRGHPQVPAGVPRRLQGPRAVPPAGADRKVPGRGQDRPQRRGHGPGERSPRPSTSPRPPAPSWRRRRAAAIRSGTAPPWTSPCPRDRSRFRCRTCAARSRTPRSRPSKPQA